MEPGTASERLRSALRYITNGGKPANNGSKSIFSYLLLLSFIFRCAFSLSKYSGQGRSACVLFRSVFILLRPETRSARYLRYFRAVALPALLFFYLARFLQFLSARWGHVEAIWGHLGRYLHLLSASWGHLGGNLGLILAPSCLQDGPKWPEDGPK